MARAKPHTQTEIDARNELTTDKLWFDFSYGLRVLKIEKQQDRATCEEWLNQSFVNYLLASRADAQETPARKRATLLAARSRILEQSGAPWRLPPSVETAVRARMGHGVPLRNAIDTEIEYLGGAAIRGQRPSHAIRSLIMSLLAAAERFDPSLRPLVEVPPWDPVPALDKHRNPDPPPRLVEKNRPRLTQRHKNFLVAVLEYDLRLPKGRAHFDFEDNPSRSRRRLWRCAANKGEKRRKTPDQK
jgi:hypothetical protein